MITTPRNEFEESMVPPNRIGIIETETTVTIFMPGDETTKEWIAVHPVEVPLEVPE